MARGGTHPSGWSPHVVAVGQDRTRLAEEHQRRRRRQERVAMAVPRHCHQCRKTLPPRSAPTFTVEPDGAYRRWTPEQTAFFALFGVYRHLVALCPACDAGVSE